MNRRVGIITFHYSYNYGSVLQAYALKRLLELKGNDVSVINFILIETLSNISLFEVILI